MHTGGHLSERASLGRRVGRRNAKKIVLAAFDLLYLNGYDLRKLPLVERKALLKDLVTGTDVQFSQSFEVDGREMYQHACKVDHHQNVIRDTHAFGLPGLTALSRLAVEN
jgi:ATP-dependent DNA ligase